MVGLKDALGTGVLILILLFPLYFGAIFSTLIVLLGQPRPK